MPCIRIADSVHIETTIRYEDGRQSHITDMDQND